MKKEIKNRDIEDGSQTSKDTKKSKMPLIIIFCIILICAGLGIYYAYTQDNNKAEEVLKEKIEVDPTIKVIEDKTAPKILLSKDSYTMYVGNTEYDFGVETYDDYGDVEITYDDSKVDYNTAGAYEVTINATDKSGNVSSTKATLNIEDKPVVTKTVTKNVYINSSSNSSNASNEISTSSGSTLTREQREADLKHYQELCAADDYSAALSPERSEFMRYYIATYGTRPYCGVPQQ